MIFKNPCKTSVATKVKGCLVEVITLTKLNSNVECYKLMYKFFTKIGK